MIHAGNELKVSPLFDDLCSVLYNRTFKTVLCVSKAGSVAVYNIEDGSDFNKFTIPNNTPVVMDDGAVSPDKTVNSANKRINSTLFSTESNTGGGTLFNSTMNSVRIQNQSHQLSSTNFIIAACLDGADRRLIVYTQIGVVQFWNYTTGSLLFEVNPQVPTSMGTCIMSFLCFSCDFYS